MYYYDTYCVMTKNIDRDWAYLKVIRKAKRWKPKFEWVGSVEICADMINKPHENYPLRVNATEELIKSGSTLSSFEWSDARQMHSYLFRGELNINNIVVGNFRKCKVQVGRYKPPDVSKLQGLITLEHHFSRG